MFNFSNLPVSFLIYFLLFVIVFHISFPLLFGVLYSLKDLDSWAWPPVVGGPSPNCWINRDTQTSWNTIWSEGSWRATSQHLVLALLNCLQTPVLKFSGQSISERRTQFRLTTTKKMIWQKICYRQKSKVKKPKRPHKWRGNRETTWKKISVRILKMIQNLENTMEVWILKNTRNV